MKKQQKIEKFLDIRGKIKKTLFSRLKKQLPKRAIKVLGISQLVCAFIVIITQIILISHMGTDFDIPAIGTGIWTGFFFGVTGLMGLFASQKPSKCK